MDIVKWYIEVFEQGFDTKTIIKDFIEGQAEIKRLQEKLKYTKNKLLK